jgi:phospholipase C
VIALAGVVCLAARVSAQEDRGMWSATSTNAHAITGDITIAEAKVTLNFAAFPLAQIRRLKPVEVSAVFDADVNAGIEGTLYRLHVPPGKYIVKRNTLCGGEETQWMATYATGHALKVAFFSGDDMPVFTFDAMQNATTLCGKFTYGR